MKKRTATLLCGIFLSVGALALFCGNPQNPYTQPKSAIIVADSSLRSLNDSVKAFTAVPCTVPSCPAQPDRQHSCSRCEVRLRYDHRGGRRFRVNIRLWFLHRITGRLSGESDRRALGQFR